MQQNHYNACLAELVVLADRLANSMPLLTTAAADRGQFDNLMRAKQLAEDLAIELSELQVTEASRNTRAWLPGFREVTHA